MTIPHTEDVTSKRLNNISGARTDCGGNQSVRPATAPALLALAPHPSMLTNATAPALLAFAPPLSVIANAPAPVCLRGRAVDHGYKS